MASLRTHGNLAAVLPLPCFAHAALGSSCPASPLLSSSTSCSTSPLLLTRPLSLGAPLLLCPGSTSSSLSGLKLSKWQAHCQVLFSYLSLHLMSRCFLLSIVTAGIASAPSLISHEFETWHLVAFSQSLLLVWSVSFPRACAVNWPKTEVVCFCAWDRTIPGTALAPRLSALIYLTLFFVFFPFYG